MGNILSTSGDCARWLKDDRSDRCEHVVSGQNKAFTVLCEDDSFGIVGRNVVCKACHDALENQEAWPGCEFCTEHRTNSEVSQWLYHDFYAAQGDEPCHVCHDCRQNNEKFKAMVARDHRQGIEEEIHLNLRCGNCEVHIGSKFSPGGQSYCKCCDRCGRAKEEINQPLCGSCAVRCEECDAELIGGVCPALKCDACQTCLDSIGQVVDLCRECACSAERDKEWAAYALELTAAAAEGRALDIGKTPCW